MGAVIKNSVLTGKFLNNFIFIVVISWLLSACAAKPPVVVKINDQYSVEDNFHVVLAKTTNETGKQYDIDITDMLSKDLEEQLRKNALFSPVKNSGDIVLLNKIVKYEKGNAFKRWLFPGAGSTILIISSEIQDYEGNIVGSIASEHSVVVGGAFTIGAWKSIFQTASRDIVDKLIAKLEERQEG